MVIAKVKTVDNIHRVVRYVLVDRTPNAQRIYTNIAAAFETEADAPRTVADRISDEFIETADLNPKVSRPYYHISLSPDKADNLSLGEWRSFSRDFLDEMGLRDHQAVAYLHEDTTFPDGSRRPHLHFVINLINEYGERASTRNDYFRTETVLRKLEHDYNLTPVTPSWETQRRRDTAYSAQATTVNSTARTQIQQAIDEALPQSSSLDELQARLKQQGITVKHYEYEEGPGWAFEKEGVHLAGYQLGRAYTKPAIARALLQQTPVSQPQSPYSASQDIAPSQASQPKRSMGEILSLSQTPEPLPIQPTNEPDQPEQADPLEELQSAQSLGRSLLDFGNRIQTQTPEVDGMTVGGTAVTLAGVVVTLGAAFQQALIEGRQREQSQRMAGLIDRLQDIGDRTSSLEEHFANQQASASPETQGVTKTQILTDRTAEEAFQAPEAESFPDLWADDDTADPVSEPNHSPESDVFTKEKQPSDFLNDSLFIANERLNQLDRLAGIDESKESKRTQFHLDRQAPLPKQLDQLEAAINTLSARLERLEEVVLGNQRQSPNEIAPEEVADSLFNYVNSRAEVYNISPTDPIQTQTLGTITLQEDDDATTVSVTDETYGVKFEAVKLDSSLGEAPTWVITHYDLSPAEAARIVRQPQTPDAYEKQANARELIGYFKRAAPDQFAGQSGWIDWNEKSGEFTYSFHIAKQPDGGHRITGVNAAQETVFDTQIHPDGGIQTHQSDIPTEQINDLLSDEAKAQQRSRQRESSRQRTKDRQLSL